MLWWTISLWIVNLLAIALAVTLSCNDRDENKNIFTELWCYLDVFYKLKNILIFVFMTDFGVKP